MGRRWEKDCIKRGQPGLICGNKPFLLAIHTYGLRLETPRLSFIHTQNTQKRTHTHTHTYTRWCIHAVHWKAPRVYEIRGSSPLRRGIMGEGYVSLQRNVLIRACDHGCGRMCVLSGSVITLVRVWWLEQRDGLYVGAPEMHSIIDSVERHVCVYSPRSMLLDALLRGVLSLASWSSAYEPAAKGCCFWNSLRSGKRLSLGQMTSRFIVEGEKKNVVNRRLFCPGSVGPVWNLFKHSPAVPARGCFVFALYVNKSI